MREVLGDVERWRSAGEPVALATVVATWGSAPRQPGAKMAVSASGRISGSVSGGCVEGAVVEAAKQTLATGRPGLLSFGVSDENAWSVGLACGGTIQVFVEPLAGEVYETTRDAVATRRAIAVATVVSGAEELIGRKLWLRDDGVSGGGLPEPAAVHVREALAAGASRRAVISGSEIFLDVLLPAPRLVVVGGVHIAIPLVALAKTLGFETILVDPRESFASAARFPHADRIVSKWPDAALEEIRPDAATAVAVLAHDPRLDDPALMTALRGAAFYVGALGSSRTQEKRRARLREAGLSEEALARLYAPIGLDLGGRSPEEIALSVMAQIVQARNPRRTGLKRESRDG
ncbi:MAG TPA: XdhC/CoxI family protein [Thermoanaerobaculia bacterium]